MKPEWEIDYPQGAIPYINAFRQQFFDYEEIDRVLHEYLQSRPRPARDLCELGSGTGTHLLGLARMGYRCLGVDSNQESVTIARTAAREAGLEIDFAHMDFNVELPQTPQDAVLVLFVPLAIPDLQALAIRAAPIIRPGGSFICMMLGADPKVAGKQTASHQDMELARLDNETVVRFNFYQKQGTRIDWDAIYLIGNSNGTRFERDHDTFDLLGDGDKLDLPRGLFRHAARLDISRCKEEQCPPLTVEVLDAFERLSDPHEG